MLLLRPGLLCWLAGVEGQRERRRAASRSGRGSTIMAGGGEVPLTLPYISGAASLLAFVAYDQVTAMCQCTWGAGLVGATRGHKCCVLHVLHVLPAANCDVTIYTACCTCRQLGWRPTATMG